MADASSLREELEAGYETAQISGDDVAEGYDNALGWLNQLLQAGRIPDLASLKKGLEFYVEDANKNRRKHPVRI